MSSFQRKEWSVGSLGGKREGKVKTDNLLWKAWALRTRKGPFPEGSGTKTKQSAQRREFAGGSEK